ncbi:MAG: SpoIID/LytB domain-containing protein [Deltaproteobacteria bacterium]|nr:SpoIID/LytB domain-containing protein [Deltaproteobacteria bacterium]MDQ3298031.1 SpoIID/LytB domain-containing protein [Myxococcota bacterium]
MFRSPFRGVLDVCVTALWGCLAAVLFLAAFAAPFVVGLRIASADETSATDKLRILYSTRFTFTDDGLPLVTVEIMGNRKDVRMRAKGGIVVRPDGQGGSTVESDGGEAWTITAEHTRPAVIHDWTIVDTLTPDDAPGVAAALTRWKERGYEPRSFEIGTMFGVNGAVIDTREVRIAIDPVAKGKGSARATEIAKRFGVRTSVHQELVRRPAGTIVAKSGATTIRNPSVLWFTPKRGTETITVADVPVGTGGSQLATSTEDRRYWGAVYVTLDHDGSLIAANAVPEDKLLAGLVPAEMYPDAPASALEAQAIAARTELLQKIGRRNLTDPFLLCSTQQCQVYAGAGKEDPRTTRAVEKTRGLVLLREGGGMVDIRYSASCGGHSEDNDAIWGGNPDPSLRGRVDHSKGGMTRVTDANLGAFLDADDGAWCEEKSKPGKLGKGRFRWTESMRAQDLDARIAAEFPEIGRVTALVPKQRGVSGRIGVLAIKGDKGVIEVAGDLRIRRLLGGLKSSLFEVKRQGESWVFRGAGFGHGVGMCQMGAMGMASAGKTYTQILGHYYRGTHLHRLY